MTKRLYHTGPDERFEPLFFWLMEGQKVIVSLTELERYPDMYAEVDLYPYL